MVQPVKLLRDVKWLYPRPVTTAAVQAVAISTTVLARALLPEAWRPPGVLWVPVASNGAYVALRLGAHTGWSKRFKHSVLDWFGGDVDDAQTWLLGALSGGGILVLAQLVRRGLAGRSAVAGRVTVT